MARLSRSAAILLVSGYLFSVSGCTTSTPPMAPAGKNGPPEAQTSAAAEANVQADDVKEGVWPDYPDVPKFEIMTEVNGIPIPRQASKGQTLQLTGKIPADVGNEHAKANPSEPTTGDTLTVRFNSEPKALNPITQSDAVRTYIGMNVQERLAHENPESFEYEPRLASKWIVEDCVKLSADYPGHQRRLIRDDGKPVVSIEFDYQAPPPGPPGSAAPEPPEIKLITTDVDGQPLGQVWVGVYAVGKIPGAPTMGHHYWSDSEGTLSLSGLRNGKYVAKVGAEIYGATKSGDGDSLIVSAASEENPLAELIKSTGEKSLTLKPGEWIDVHRQTYSTYYLHPEAKWSDGAPFTSKDIEFANALLRNRYVDGDHIRTYYSDVVECTPLTPQIVRMKFRQQYFKSAEVTHEIGLFTPPFHFFADIFQKEGRELTLESLTPEQEQAQKKISAHGQEFGKFFNMDDRYNRAPLGTGPYIIDKWESKDRVELVRNPNYWNPKRAGHVDRIIIKFIPDQVLAMSALKSGAIDFFYDMSPEQFFEDWPNVDAETRANFVPASWYSPAFAYFGWNQLAPQFQDRRVRIALALLFDRQDFVDTKLHGAGVVVSGTQYYFGPGYDREVAPLGYDPETARELLADAGWVDTDNDGVLDRDGQKFQVILRVPPGKPIITQRCEVLQKNLKSVGIDLQIQPLEWASFIDKLRAKECDVATLSWATPVESDPFQIWHSSEAGRERRGSNTISFADPQADSLIEMLRITLDPEKRKRIHSSLHRLLDSEQPYMFLWIPKEFGAYHRRFRNVKWYRLRPGFDLTEWYVPKNEQVH